MKLPVAKMECIWLLASPKHARKEPKINDCPGENSNLQILAGCMNESAALCLLDGWSTQSLIWTSRQHGCATMLDYAVEVSTVGCKEQTPAQNEVLSPRSRETLARKTRHVPIRIMWHASKKTMRAHGKAALPNARAKVRASKRSLTNCIPLTISSIKWGGFTLHILKKRKLFVHDVATAFHYFPEALARR